MSRTALAICVALDADFRTHGAVALSPSVAGQPMASHLTASCKSLSQVWHCLRPAMILARLGCAGPFLQQHSTMRG
eukprot:7911284-Alexandrium_andersonii.AAC.1